MIYKDFHGKKLSALGMGCMRLPVKNGNDAEIDIDAVNEMVDYAMKNGINYYDTAWGYHGGNSEPIIGQALEAYPRDSFYLASKFPGYDLSLMDKVEEIFEKQLKRCRTEYFDFYLFHNLCEMNINQYLDPKYRIFNYLTEQKKNGRIKHLGVSVHGSLETMKRFLEAYGDHIEFCQLQLNWLDWDFQNVKAKVELADSYNIPIWVMEPVRGGSLAALKPEYESILKQLRPKATNAEWAFRFLQSIPQVTVTLSGMSDLKQLKENIDTYAEEKPLSSDEINTLFDIGRSMTEKKTLPCTSCRYCVSHCPQGLNIPWLIELYNEHIYTGGGFIAPMALSSLSEDKLPSACLACGACEAVCPQTIKISEMMSDFSEKTK